MADDENDPYTKRVWTAEDLTRLPTTRWIVPNLLPAPGVVMISGPRSSLKSYILLSAMLSVVYGRTWWDGIKLTPGLCIYITGEDERRVGPRRIAWLRVHDLPDHTSLDAFRVINVNHEYYLRGEKGRPDKLDLLDPETVKVLGDDLAEMARREGLPVAVVALDPVTSLVPRLVDPVTRQLVRHCKQIAQHLSCSVAIVNHTHRNNADRSQGSFYLADSIDGDFIAHRDQLHRTNGVVTGLRTMLEAKRLKDGFEKYTTEWIGTPLNMTKDDGSTEPTCAMECIGVTDAPVIDLVATNRAWIASKIPPGSVSFADACRLCGWSKGGNQYLALRDAIPEVWVAIQLPIGDEVRELRRIKHGRGERIECRVVTAAPEQTVKPQPPPPKHEPEVVKVAKPTTESGKPSGAGKPLGTIRQGTMEKDTFHATLDEPLDADDPRQSLNYRIQTLRAGGATITDEGERVLVWLAEFGTTPKGMGVIATLFTKATTTREALKTVATRMKTAGNGKKPNRDGEAGNDGDPPTMDSQAQQAILEQLRDSPLGQINQIDAEDCRLQVQECASTHGLHKLLGDPESVTLASAYRTRFYQTIGQLSSLSGAKITAEAQQAIDAAKRIRAAPWWIEHGSRSATNILTEAEIWAANRRAARKAN
jgi:hypothetical protein